MAIATTTSFWYYTVQRKKQNLIRDANIKKSYAKVKDRELSKNPAAFDAIYLTEAPKPSSQELHPERRAMLDGPKPTAPLDSTFTTKKDHRRRHPKANPFQKEAHLARQRIEQAKEKQKAIEYSQKQRQEKLMERDRYRKAMAKARTGGKNGQRKLGRESKILLEKVKMIMSE